MDHYPHSLKAFLQNVTALLTDGGIVRPEVPNIAYWPKRVAFLREETPLVDARVVFRSGVPFVGHHHEFTMEELRGVAGLAGLEVLHEDCNNYPLLAMGWKRQVRRVTELAFALAPSSRECLSISCREGAATFTQ